MKILALPDAIADPRDKQKVVTKSPADIQFMASVKGVPDTSVVWKSYPTRTVQKREAATVINGHFKTPNAATYTVSARSNYDPRLVDAYRLRLIVRDPLIAE